MVEHIVLLKFSQEATQAQKEELIRRTFALKNIIPGIVNLQQGFNFSDRNNGFEVGLTVRFEDRNTLNNYVPHPSLKQLLPTSQEIGVEDSIIVDFETR